MRRERCEAHLTCSAETIELEGNPGRLAQVVTNVLSNALDASRTAASRRIDLSLVKNDGRVELTVRDQGCGMSPEVASKIFDPLFTTKPFGEGTGLGLTLVRDIVTTDFEGSVQVESALGQGATFTFSFPAPGVSLNGA